MSKSEELAAKLAKNIPQEVIVKNATSVANTTPLPSGDLEDDYEYSRERYRALVDKGTEAIDHMMELALQSDHPRAYEVLGGMLKSVSDMTDKLVALHGTVEKVKAAKTAPQGGSSSSGASTPSVTNNNVFVGSTTELQRFIIAQQKQNVIDASPSEE
jgi:hypothetical protein